MSRGLRSYMQAARCWLCRRTGEEAARELGDMRRATGYTEGEYYTQITSQFVLLKRKAGGKVEEEDYWLKVPLCEVCAGLLFALDYNLTKDCELTIKAELAKAAKLK